MEEEVRSRLISLGLEAQQLNLAIQRVAQSKVNSLIDEAESQAELMFSYVRSRVNSVSGA